MTFDFWHLERLALILISWHFQVKFNSKPVKPAAKTTFTSRAFFLLCIECEKSDLNLKAENNWRRKKLIFVCGPTAYFHRGEYNIIIVDYGTLVKEPCLSQIGWGPRFCARCIAQLLYYLDQVSGTPPDSLHLIGYSVGAHIAGLVANYISFGKIGRITGNFF